MNLKRRIIKIEKRVGIEKKDKERELLQKTFAEWYKTLSSEDRIVILKILGILRREKEGREMMRECSLEEYRRYLQLNKEVRRFVKNKGYATTSGFLLLPEFKELLSVKPCIIDK